MKTKNFLVSGIVAGILNFLLGWVFYAQLFPNLYPSEENNLLFIFLGCLTYGLFMAYFFTKAASITATKSGMQTGAIFGFFYALTMNFFMYASLDPNYQNMAIDVAINIVIGAILGAVIAMINGKMK